MEPKITKQIASILYGYGYKLQDNEGNVYDIDAVGIYGITLYNGDYHDTIDFDKIGSTYKILARDLEQLTQEIDGEVPLMECARIAFPDDDFHIVRNACVSKDGLTRFNFIKTHFIADIYDGEWYREASISDQLSLFRHLYSLNFNVGFPENTTFNLI